MCGGPPPNALSSEGRHHCAGTHPASTTVSQRADVMEAPTESSRDQGTHSKSVVTMVSFSNEDLAPRCMPENGRRVPPPQMNKAAHRPRGQSKQGVKNKYSNDTAAKSRYKRTGVQNRSKTGETQSIKISIFTNICTHTHIYINCVQNLGK